MATPPRHSLIPPPSQGGVRGGTATPQVFAPFLSLAARPAFSIFQWENARGPRCACKSVSFVERRPEVVAIPLPALRTRAIGAVLPEGRDACRRDGRQAAHVRVGANAELPSAPSLHAQRPALTTITRVRPPRDLVKLEDRLYYVLQPPLETLLAVGSLVLPRSSRFRISSRASRFSIPRYRRSWPTRWAWAKRCRRSRRCALLAPLGRAATSVLLICPKPLVTNWRREFAQWAPEIPLTIIEGDQPQRHWQWTQRPKRRCKIANYELLMRDRDVARRDLQLRPGRARRSPADQEHEQRHQPGRPRSIRAREAGPSPARRSKTRRRPGRHLRIPLAGLPAPQMKAAAIRRAGQRPHPAPHEGHGADRSAAQDCFAMPSSTSRPSSGRPTKWPRTKASCSSTRWATSSRFSTSSSWCCG